MPHTGTLRPCRPGEEACRALWLGDRNGSAQRPVLSRWPRQPTRLAPARGVSLRPPPRPFYACVVRENKRPLAGRPDVENIAVSGRRRRDVFLRGWVLLRHPDTTRQMRQWLHPFYRRASRSVLDIATVEFCASVGAQIPGTHLDRSRSTMVA